MNIYIKEFVCPEELMRAPKNFALRRQWVVHRGKIPYNPCALNAPAKSNAPETWGTLQDALSALETGNFDGIGFQFGNFEPETLRVSGIDLDHVIRSDGSLEPFAAEIVELMNSYTEYSPSGTGLHILCETVLKDIGRKKGINDTCAIEMYNHGRYFTFTGKIYGTPKPIEERSKEFQEIYEKYFSEPSKPEIKITEFSELNDKELLEKMFNSRRGDEIQKLFSGDWSGYPSQSEADLALVSHLIFWTQGDENRTDSLFRQSGLMRSKWERADYRSRTINLALNRSFNNLTSYPHVEASKTHSYSERLSGLPFAKMAGQSVGFYVMNRLRNDKLEFTKNGSRKTGFENLDAITKLYSGVYVLGAISSLGKTTFACQLADQLAEAGEHVLYFSLEQSQFELVTKGLSRLTAKQNMKTALTAMEIRDGKRTPELEEAEKEYIKNNNEIIYECGFDTNIEMILNTVKDYIEDNKVKPVVIVDYLQIIRPVDIRISTKDAVDNHVRAFKKLQVDNDLVVLLISSLNRSNYLTPVDFEAFKESGGIEYTADVIWGLQLSVMNDEMFDKDKNLKTKRETVREAKKAIPREVELVCLKNRYGISSYSCKFDYYAQFDYFVPKVSRVSKKSNRNELIF